MKKTYIVTAITKESIIVSPEQNVLPESPLNPYGIEVTNPKKLKIQVGSRVRIGLSSLNEAIDGLLCLVFPVLGAFLGFYLAPKIETLLNFELSSVFSAAVISVGFFIPCAVIFLISRSLPAIVRLRITTVLG